MSECGLLWPFDPAGVPSKPAAGWAAGSAAAGATVPATANAPTFNQTFGLKNKFASRVLVGSGARKKDIRKCRRCRRQSSRYAQFEFFFSQRNLECLQ